MGDTGFVKFPTSLDPRAEEFHPITHITASFQQIYYPYYPQPITDLHLITHINGPPPFYNNAPPLPPPLPTPSMSPTRTLLLSSVPTDVSESEVRRDLEVFGDVRAVEMGRVRDGIVTVHFYDVRDAQRAAVEIRRQHMRQQGRIRAHYDAVVSAGNFDSVVVAPPVGPGVVGGHAVWALFKYPVGLCGVTDGVNHGTIVVFNLDDGVNTAWLKQIFEAFGPVKELRETPSKRHQRFIEFYDVRHASRARTQMNGKEINGKQIVIEFSRPGGHIKKSTSNKTTHQTHSVKTVHSPPHHHFSKPNPNSLPPPRFSHQIHGGGGGAGGGPDLPPHFYDSKTQFKSKKGGNCKGNSNGFTITNESDHGHGKGVKKSLKKGGESNNGNGGGKKLESTRKVSGGSKMFLKGRSSQGKSCLDPRFLINEGRVVSEMDCKDSRTTVMIKNIPNKYSQKLLLNMLDNHCIHCNENIADDGPLSSYDFVYLPIDFINKCNVGYGFVNMTSPQATLRLYKAFHLQNWEVFNSKKICEVTYARLQGVEALKEHFKNSKFPGEADEYLPVIFSPPRDGSQLTEPTPVVNLLQSPSAVSCSSDSSSKETNDDNDVQPEQEEEVNGGINNNGCHSNDGFGGGDNDVGGGGSDSCSSTTPNGCDDGHYPYDQ